VQLLQQMSERIEGSERLGGWAGSLHDGVARFLPSGRLRDIASGTWLGHPVHPFLVSTPIGCWTSASLLDMLGQRKAAQTLVGAGVLTVVPTAITGLSDWADTAQGEQRMGLVHLGLAGFATTIYASSWGARRLGHHRAGVRLAVLGAVAASGAGWLGGHLAYALGVGVDTNAFDGGPSEWTAIDGQAPTPGVAGSASAAGIALVVVSNDDGGLMVLADRCSHRGGPLSQGTFADGCVTCPWHGSRFEARNGQVRRGPAVAAQPSYDVRHEGTEIKVRRDEPRALRANSVRPH
jgi:nitrite reductase/ring-hydroxylating ferredoxin subunit/uncharacterized membrane protein